MARAPRTPDISKDPLFRAHAAATRTRCRPTGRRRGRRELQAPRTSRQAAGALGATAARARRRVPPPHSAAQPGPAPSRMPCYPQIESILERAERVMASREYSPRTRPRTAPG